MAKQINDRSYPRKHLEYAIDLALQNQDRSSWLHSAVLLKSGKKISEGINSNNRSCIHGDFSRTAFHAEVACMVKARQRIL